MAIAYVGLGSNLADRWAHLRLAKSRLLALPQTELVGFSSVYETSPVGPVEQEAYLNAVAALETELTPADLMSHCAGIEAEAGRPEAEQRVKWGPRTLDLDLLLYDDQVISQDDLVVPHPLMHDRWFVLQPLVDLNPRLIHPLLQMTVSDLLAHLEEMPAGTREGFGREVTVEW